ncbi:MAG: class I SAM-dependent methyltransferase [Enterococcus sp.]
MNEYMDELRDFWDDFAEDYEQIQQESSFPVVEDLTAFLISEKIFPCQTFLDLAGGTGRYLPSFQQQVEHYILVDISEKMLHYAQNKAADNVLFINQSQATFLAQANTRFDVVFSAMNPALKTSRDLTAFQRISRNWCLLFRTIQEEDTLFSPYEAANPDLLLNQQYKNFLHAEKIPYKIKQFSYKKSEKITRDFFQAYFENDFSAAELAKMTEKTFGDAQQKNNESRLTFELIYFQVPKAYNENDL